MILSHASLGQLLGVIVAAGLLACSSTTNDNGDATTQDSSPTDSGSGDGTTTDSGSGDVGDAGGDSSSDSPGETSSDAPTDTPTDTKTAKALELAATESFNGTNSGFTCARMSDGTVKCWGFDEMGQTGVDPTASDACDPGALPCTKTPKTVAGLSNVTKIAVGGEHACAILSDKTVMCWGANGSKQLGATSGETCVPAGASFAYPCSHTPLAVTGLSNVTDLSLGSDHSCALLGDNTMKCWGSNETKQLGVGSATVESCTDPTSTHDCIGTPTSPSGLTDVIAIAAGSGHTCATTTAGSTPGTKCWGANGQSQLADGTTTDRDVPTDMAGGGSFVPLWTGGTSSYTCGGQAGAGTVLDVLCWGDNADKQIAGSGATVTSPSSLSYISADKTPTAFVGGNTVFVLEADGMFAAGRNDVGQLGDGTTSTPADHTAPTGFTFDQVQQFAPGGDHTCALLTDSSVMCWGANVTGQLGDGTVTESHTPKKIF